MPSIHALEEHIGPVCTWPQWLRDAVQANHLSEADLFGLGRALLGNGLSPAHFAAFVIGAGFVRDQRSAYKMKRLLTRFRAGELHTYYDLEGADVKIVADAPRAVVRALRVPGHGREQRGNVVGGAARGKLGAEQRQLGSRECERVGLRRRRRRRLGEQVRLRPCEQLPKDSLFVAHGCEGLCPGTSRRLEARR